jgi:ketosteroid isomerase-like protein
VTDLTAVARSYFDAVRAQDAVGLGGMFAADGVLILPDGTRLAGPAAVEAFYLDLFAKGPPTPTVRATITEGVRCLVELTARQPNGAEGHAADVFTFDRGGLIAELAIYARAGGDASAG